MRLLRKPTLPLKAATNVDGLSLQSDWYQSATIPGKAASYMQSVSDINCISLRVISVSRSQTFL